MPAGCPGLHLPGGGKGQGSDKEASPSPAGGGGVESQGEERKAPGGGKDMTMQRTGAWGTAIPRGEGTFSWWRYSAFIVVAFVLMLMLTLYVWSHVRMTQLEYRIAAELNRKEQLLEEQRKMKMEVATLKSRKRIEAIARDTLNMTFPEQDQVIIVK